MTDKVSVPSNPTNEMCGGLAKGIMTWSHFVGARTVKRLFAHLELMNIPIPQWMRQEPELQDVTHVPNESVHCMLIYKAMIHTHLHS